MATAESLTLPWNPNPRSPASAGMNPINTIFEWRKPQCFPPTRGETAGTHERAQLPSATEMSLSRSVVVVACAFATIIPGSAMNSNII